MPRVADVRDPRCSLPRSGIGKSVPYGFRMMKVMHAGVDRAPARTMHAKSVELRNVSKRFGSTTAVRALDLRVEPGEFLTLLGPSGCGKTTLLRMVAGLEAVTTGSILVDGVDVTELPPHRRDTSIMFQDYALFPHKTLAENVAYGLKMRGVSRAQREAAAMDWLVRIGLSGMGARMPHQLSGGQRQRVALARSLIINPGVLLLDEPLGALDANLRKQMQGELKRLHREVGLTFVYVTHDQEEALVMSDRIAVMNDGTIEQLSDPQTIYDQPETEFVARFIGHCNVVHATVSGVVDGYALCDAGSLGRTRMAATAGIEVGATVTLALRPEAIELSANVETDGFNRALMTISDVRFTGSTHVIGMQSADGQEIEVELNRREAPSRLPAPGEEVAVGWSESALRLLRRQAREQ